jgi:hypothetical protein
MRGKSFGIEIEQSTDASEGKYVKIGATVSINCMVCSKDDELPHASVTVKNLTTLELGDMQPPEPARSVNDMSESSLQSSKASTSSRIASVQANSMKYGVVPKSGEVVSE